MTSQKHIIIIGAGISGLSLAWKLCAKGFKIDLFESQSIVGGLASTRRKDHYSMDFGPHSFFSDDSEILATILDIFNENLLSRPRKVKFYYKKIYLNYPLTVYNILFRMGMASGIKAFFSFLKSKVISKKIKYVIGEEETVEDWAINNFGNHLYQIFFKPYTEQFWKIPCNKLSSKTIPTHTRLSFINTFRLLLHCPSTATDASLIEREMLPTYYPKTGFGEIPEKIAILIQKRGVRVHLNCNVTKLSNIFDKNLHVEYKENGQKKTIKGTKIISTIPINRLVKMLRPTPPLTILEAADKINYKPLLVLGMVTDKQNILGCNYIYVLDRPYTRISELNKFSSKTSPFDENILTVEIPCTRDSAAWTATKEDLFKMCIESLTKDGFLTPTDVKKLLLIKAPYAYPIYHKNYAVNLQKLVEYIKQHDGIEILGRNGEFSYMDIDRCIRRAFDLAEKLTNYL
ncbi:FAD-dependent oxidoreductase [Candidatus Auribacterota bacterium]